MSHVTRFLLSPRVSKDWQKIWAYELTR